MRNAQEIVNEVKECRNTLLLHALKSNNNHSMLIEEYSVDITVFADKTIVTVKDNDYEYMLDCFHNMHMTNEVKADDEADLLDLLETIDKVISLADYRREEYDDEINDDLANQIAKLRPYYRDKAMHMTQVAIQKVIEEAKNEIINS